MLQTVSFNELIIRLMFVTTSFPPSIAGPFPDFMITYLTPLSRYTVSAPDWTNELELVQLEVKIATATISRMYENFICDNLFNQVTKMTSEIDALNYIQSSSCLKNASFISIKSKSAEKLGKGHSLSRNL